jgi:hypothetical protein
MVSETGQHFEELREIYTKRLYILETQAAAYGILAPTHILTEIEELKQRVEGINLQLAELKKSSPQFSAGSPAITILFLSADPSTESRLRLGEEVREIHEKLQLAKLREQIKLEQRMSVRPTDLSQSLLDTQPQIVHFSGHGSESGALCFETLSGETHPIDADALSALFESFAKHVDCVLLNACYSEIQGKAIAKHINYVIGMNQAIGDRAAIAFSIGFYQGVGAGRNIEDAYKLGCVQIRLQGILEHLTPVLIRRENSSI